MSRDEDVRLVKEFVSRIIPRRKLGYMKNVYRAGVSSGLQG